MTVFFQQLQRTLVMLKSQPEQLSFTFDHGDIDLAFENQVATGPGRFTATNVGQYVMTVFYALDQHLQLTTRALLTMQPGRDDPGIVKDQEIIGLYQVNNVSEMEIDTGLTSKM